MKQLTLLPISTAKAMLFLGVVFSLILLGHAAIAYAVTPADDTIQGITFPVPELGNCADKSDCRAYCDDAAHMESCIAFGQKHGLINETEAKRAQGFAKALKSGDGPGGCASQNECNNYCSSLDHLEQCLDFAKSNNINDRHVAEGEKILKHMQQGGKTPGGCSSKENCQAYCGDFSHAKECYEFAKAAGIEQGGDSETGPGDSGNNPTPEQLEKLAELTQKGETPGGCTSKDSCQAYCGEPGHGEECVAFGVKAGFIRP